MRCLLLVLIWHHGHRLSGDSVGSIDDIGDGGEADLILFRGRVGDRLCLVLHCYNNCGLEV